MDAMETKLKQKILESKTYTKREVPGAQYQAPITRHYFDGFMVEKCHNGNSLVRLIVNGDTVARVSRDVFSDALKARAEKSKAEFLA